MENYARVPAPENMFNEYFVPIFSEPNSALFVSLIGITYPNPDYKICRLNEEYYTFEYVISGQGTVIENDQVIYPKEGDVYIMHPHKNLNYFSDKNNPWKKIWINVEGNLVKELLTAYGLEDVLLIPNFKRSDFLERILMTAEQGNCTPGNIALPLHEFIAALSEFVNSKGNNTPAHTMKEYITHNIDKNITLDDLCSLVHLSKSRTIQIFRKEFNITPYTYIMNSKSQMASALLIKTDLPVNEIALRLGFSNPHNFSSFFKKITGTTPGAYRQSNR